MSLTEPPPLRAASPIERWALDPQVVHLNHGSFGGCPRAVLDAAAAWRARLEASPMRFVMLEWQAELDRARDALAAFVRAPASQLAFVPSSTTGVAIALHSLELAAGDEVLVTDHGYRACRNQLERLAAARGLRIATVAIALPFDPAAFAESILRAITPATKAVLLDHITSPTALRFPIEQLVPALAARGLITIIDGAHAPGQLDLDVGAIGATYYVGNCHKWMCAPKGSGFLVVAEGARTVPVVTSHGASPDYGPANRLHAELDWNGTHDPSARLAVPATIAAVAAEGGGWPAIFARNHALVTEMRRRFIAALGRTQAPVLAPDASLGAMAAIRVALPPNTSAFALEHALLVDGWEVPVIPFESGALVRISAHLYNHAGEADELARELHVRGIRLA
ncbi:MAG: aminotransferase class V-fold PLP-dependent enzyme [Kofleriaceae bacterium]